MSPATPGPRYLMRWNFCRDQRIDDVPMSVEHRLGVLSMFTDAGLADLVDRFPSTAIVIETGCDPSNELDASYPSRRRIGSIGAVDGQSLLTMLQEGNFSIILKNVEKHSPPLNRLLNRLRQELTECNESLRIQEFGGDLHLASPKFHTYMRCDSDPSIRWQIRGNDKIISYPPNIVGKQDLIERILATDRDSAYREPLYYEPAMESQSRSDEILAGHLRSVMPATPHRIIVGDSVCVSLLTRYRTDRSVRCDNATLAEPLLSRLSTALPKLPVRSLSPLAARPIANLQRRRKQIVHGSDLSFQLDPKAHDFLGSLQTPASESVEEKSQSTFVFVPDCVPDGQPPTYVPSLPGQ